jgi:hypothetical protein
LNEQYFWITALLTWNTGHLFVRGVSSKMKISISSLCEMENLNTYAMNEESVDNGIMDIIIIIIIIHYPH